MPARNHPQPPPHPPHHQPGESTVNHRPASSPDWIVKSSTIHGTGLFARRNLPPGLRVIEYVGRKISKDESLSLCHTENPYIFYINEQWDLDGRVDWNPARFINHSCQPNCEAEQEENRIWIATLRPIRAGEELTYNYGYDLEEYRDYPCHCGSPGCVGYIVAEEFIPLVAKSNLLRASTSPEQPKSQIPV